MTNENTENSASAEEPVIHEITSVQASAEPAPVAVDDQVVAATETEAIVVDESLVEEVAVADSGVAAGWYPNPTSPNEERYWDGAVWTDQVRPQTVAAPAVVSSRILVDADGQLVSPKSRAVAALLCFFFGGLGIHRFYVGKVGTGILMLVTLGGLGVWSLIDFIMILVGSFRDIQRRLLLNW